MKKKGNYKFLFLGYNNSKTTLINFLKKKKILVKHLSRQITLQDLKDIDLVISFGYRKILNKSLLKKLVRPAINLHISYLPYNRGAHPNFWSFIDNTPKGVSIHEIDYLSYLFGKIKEVTVLKKKMSNLPINVEDFATMIIKHKNGVISELHLDYLRPIKMRGCEIVGTDGSIIWESVGKSPEKCLVKYCKRNSKNYKNLFFDDDLDINSCYEKLAEEFIISFKNNRNDNLLSADDAISQILLIKKCKNLDAKIYENIKK